MNRVLIVLENYLTGFSQNAICIKSICSFLKDYNVDFITIEYSDVRNNENNVYVIDSPLRRTRLGSFLRRFYKMMFSPIESKKVVNKTYSLLTELTRMHQYQAVIAVENPSEAVEAVYKLKKQSRDIKCILYEIDPASNRYKNPKGFLEKYITAKNRKWENKVYKNFDTIIHMKSHYFHYEDKIFSPFKSKFVYLDIPNLVFHEETTKFANSKPPFLIYSGAFYSKIREPDLLVETLKQLKEKIPFHCTFFVNNQYVDYLQEAFLGYDEMNVSSYVPSENLLHICREADVFISLGNKESDFLPSKLFFYIGLMKPIIHFAFSSDDPVIAYLEKYPLSLILFFSNGTEKNILKIEAFFEHIKDVKPQKVDDLLSRFVENTPAYTAKKIAKIIEE